MARLPLEGVRVADVTVVWAGPYCTQLLAEWGAEVIRVEPRTRAQPMTRGAETLQREEAVRASAARGVSLLGFPHYDPLPDWWNRGASFNSHARNKLSANADFSTPEGRELFLKLIEKCDILVENNVPETIDKANIGYEVLKERNPGIIMLRMPAFGLSGPYRGYRAFGTHIEGMIGHHYLRGYRNADPAESGDVYTGDAVAGIHGAFAVTMALRHRARTGEGQLIELSQAENFLPLLGDFILDYTVNGRNTEPQANRHRSHAPHGAYPCKGDDRWVTIDCDSDGAWEAICDVLGAHDLIADERFATGVGRFNHQEELDRLLGEYTRHRDADALFWELQAAGVIAGPVWNEAQLAVDPQLAERGFFEELTRDDLGTFKYPGLIMRMANTPNALRRAPVRLAEDNEYVWREVVGLSDAEWAEAHANGQIGEGYVPGIVPPTP